MNKLDLKEVLGEWNLQDYISWLTAYCHEPGCTTPQVCPLQCCRSKHKDTSHKLNLDTAIAWEAAVLTALWVGSDNKILDGVAIKERVYQMYRVLTYHLDVYSTLAGVLARLFSMLCELRECQNDMD